MKVWPVIRWLQESKDNGRRRDMENCLMILLGCTLVGLLFYVLGLSEANIITIYILGILVVSSITSEARFGIISSIVGVLLFNCLFAEPRFTLRVFDPQYAITTIIMLGASLATNSLMLRFRQNLQQEMEANREKERATREAEDERLRANLLRTVSHDLRTPLAGIAGSADILLARGEDISIEARRQMYQSIYDDAQWLTGLVENLLFVTRLENGPIALNLQPELLHEIIPEALHHLNRRGKNQQIELQLPEDLLLVRADGRMLMQVIINIVDNAVKYAPPYSSIVVSARREENQALVEVADQGKGISEEDKKRIFEMFYSADNQQCQGRRGIGLGLALCQSIIRVHGGEIYVRDNQPQGAVIGFSLKLEGIA